jgi:histidyl-tRNA synthetase
MCMMMADTMEALGIPRGQYVIRVNNRKVLDGVMEAIGLVATNAGKRLTVRGARQVRHRSSRCCAPSTSSTSSAAEGVLRTALNPLGGDGQPLGPTVPVELFQGNPKDFPKQLRYADRRGSPIAIIQGGDEKAEGKLIVKDLIEGKRIAETITDNAEWREAKAGEHLVDESDLVITVKRVLAEQASDGQEI